MKIASALILCISGGVAYGQGESAHPLPAPRGMLLDRVWDSGTLANTESTSRVVWSTVISSPRAAWTRVHFGGCELAAGSFIRVSSVKDGEVHQLDQGQLLEWSSASAYFNGSEVLLELVADGGTARNRVTVEQVEIEVEVAGPAGDPGL